jgi:multicomponent Na+:H+ antiporter subunit F
MPASIIFISGLPMYLSIMLMVCGIFIVWRSIRGPFSADRVVAIDILGILVINICTLMAVFNQQFHLINIAFSWAILGFIGTLALAKYLEGKHFDE